MNTVQGQFPDTLVLPFTQLHGNSPPANTVALQIRQGNTFSVAFDMTHAPHAPLSDGVVILMQSPESNFRTNAAVTLPNEGLSDRIAFMSTKPITAMIFGNRHTINRIFLVGTPNGNVFTWETGIIIDRSVTVSNGVTSAEATARLAVPIAST